LARRTRRNLSDPRIKRIVRHQLQSSQSQISIAASPLGNFLSRLILPLFILFVLLLGYSLVVNSNLKFESFSGIFSSSQPQTDTPNQGKDMPTEEEISGTQTKEAEEDTKPIIEPVKQKLQVEVLNACGVSGIASTVTKYLREQGIDVVNTGNHTRFDVKETMLWERVKNTDSQRVAELLGVSNDKINSKMDPNLQLDITIILGADYPALKPFKNQNQ
jgi:hypothetical protein